MKNELTNYELNPSINRTEITATQKQIKNIDIERMPLSNQMLIDSKELSEYLTLVSKEVQNSVKSRFSLIIENFTYIYQNNL